MASLNPRLQLCRRIIQYIYRLLILSVIISNGRPMKPNEFTSAQIRYYRNKVKGMFYHAYDSYLKYAFPLDELKPLSCSGMDTWGSFSLSLIDSLDTLIIIGNSSEFVRAANIIVNQIKTNADVNVSVFETNIRVIGGLISGHLLSGHVEEMQLEAGWPCSGPLLRLAERFAQKLLPAFNTNTGMPYGTINLRYGVHRDETPITCVAGIGTVILEFGALTRLTGDLIYERVALKALDALWKARSSLGLIGNHINVQTGEWTATDAGIGAGVDSYFEYLAKGALLFQRPLLMQQFNEYVSVINKHMRKSDWFVWVSMKNAQITLPVFQSLEAFWPGLLALVGNIDDAQRILLQYSNVLRKYGFLPEFYNLPKQETVRSGYPLRPEFAESLYYIYRNTKDPLMLQLGAEIVEAIEHSCRTSCGYATVENVNDHTIEDRMESFFLSETTKYLYLIFDVDNLINNDGSKSRVIETPNGPCVVDAGGYIFNTEAHPLDPGALYCCSQKRNNDLEMIAKFEKNIDFTKFLDNDDQGYNIQTRQKISEMIDTYGRRVADQPNVNAVVKVTEYHDEINIKTDKRAIKMPSKAFREHKFLTSLLWKSFMSRYKLPSKETDVVKRYFCQNCCTIFDHKIPSTALEAFLQAIYESHIFANTQIYPYFGHVCHSVNNPITQNSLKYMRKWPDTVAHDIGTVHDAVDNLCIGCFRYHSLAEYNYSLLLSSSNSYLSYFTGVGQVVGTTNNSP